MWHTLYHTGQKWLCTECGKTTEKWFGQERVIVIGDTTVQHAYGPLLPYVPELGGPDPVPNEFMFWLERQVDEGWIV